MTDSQKGHRQRAYQLWRRPRALVDEGLNAVALKKRDRVGPARQAAGDGERLPLCIGFVLREAKRIFVGPAKRRPAQLAGSPAADIADDERQGAADRCVGAIALTERIDAAVHADRPGDRSIHN